MIRGRQIISSKTMMGVMEDIQDRINVPDVRKQTVHALRMSLAQLGMAMTVSVPHSLRRKIG